MHARLARQRDGETWLENVCLMLLRRTGQLRPLTFGRPCQPQ